MTVQNLRENCGGYGYLQYSGVPNVQENAVLNVSLESNYQDYLANFALVLLKKIGTQENVDNFLFYFLNFFYEKCEKFNTFYFPILYNHEKLEIAYNEIENLPSKSFENFVYLGRLLNLK